MLLIIIKRIKKTQIYYNSVLILIYILKYLIKIIYYYLIYMYISIYHFFIFKDCDLLNTYFFYYNFYFIKFTLLLYVYTLFTLSNIRLELLKG